jgi:hypothetical protein
LSYTIAKDGFDYALDVHPSLTEFQDLAIGSIGQQITYKLKAINHAGESPYSEEFTLTVGTVPNSP